jgi:hypothetical protein
MPTEPDSGSGLSGLQGLGRVLLGDAALRLALPAADSGPRRGLGAAAGQANRYLYRSTDMALMTTENEDRKSGVLSLLNTLAASGDNWVKAGIMAMIAISGGANFVTTKQAARSTDYEVNQALHEIHDLHDQLNAMVQRQKEMHDMLEKLSKKEP